jgi:GT2 family glycosyltransferase
MRPFRRKVPFFSARATLRRLYRLHCLVRQHAPTRDEMIAYRRLLQHGASLPDIAARLVPAADVDTVLSTINIDPSIDRLRVLPVLLPGGIRMQDEGAYLFWLEENDALSDADRATISRLIDGLSWRPRLSFTIALTRPAGPSFAASLRSIAQQAYPDVEILVVATSTAATALERSLAPHLEASNRTRLITAPHTDNSAELFNVAVKECSGAFLGLVGEADQLAETAAFEIAADLAAHPETRMIYSDEDALDRNGSRHSPLFKPDWDPDAMLAHDQVGRPMLFSTTLLRELGGMRADRGELAEYDLLLRAGRVVDAQHVRHLPSVLYHRRQERLSPWSQLRARLAYRATRARIQMVREHLMASGVTGCRVSAPRIGGAIRVAYPLPTPPPLVSIIVPTRDRVDLLRKCLHGLLHGTAYPQIEVIVVDNDSVADETLAYLDEVIRDPRVRLLRHPGPFNWSEMNNRAVAAATGDIVLLLNNDIEVLHPDWLAEMAAHALRPEVGLVGAKLLYHDHRVQHAGLVTGPAAATTHVWRYAAEHDPGYMNFLSIVRGSSAVTGACIALRKSVFDEVGGLDATNLQVTCSDSDLCFRVRAHGYRVIWTPHACLIHAELATRGADASGEKHERARREHAHLCATWGAWLDEDPFLNANLHRTDFVAHLTPRSAPRPWHTPDTEPA